MSDARILIIDDDKDFLTEIRSGLEVEGINAVFVASPVAAIDIIESNPAINIVISDFLLTGLDGLELIKKISIIRGGMNFAAILITGAANVDVAISALRVGVIDFIEKPIEISALVNAIHRAISRLEGQRPDSCFFLADPTNQMKALLAMRLDFRQIFPELRGYDTAFDMLLDLGLSEAAGENLSVSDLCSNAGTSSTTASRRLASLEKNGFVSRYPDSEDGRRTWVSLTQEGRALLTQAGKRLHQVLLGQEIED